MSERGKIQVIALLLGFLFLLFGVALVYIDNKNDKDLIAVCLTEGNDPVECGELAR